MPTIAAMVPRAAFTWVTARLRGLVSIPLVTSNRINTPEVAEEVLARGDADMISMARPLLADPDFVKKAAKDRADEINTCIGCNQACLDHIFFGQIASCLGETLGKTTGWIHRATLKQRQVIMLNGVTYDKIDDAGLHITLRGAHEVLSVDTVIICAGQEPLRDLKDELENRGMPVHLIGGADRAVELDAKRAIEQGARLAARI